MRIEVQNRNGVRCLPGETCIVSPVYAGQEPAPAPLLTAETRALLKGLVKRRIVTGKAQEIYYVPAPDKGVRGIILAGLGDRAKSNAEVVRRTAGAACVSFKKNRVTHVYVDLSGDAATHAGAWIEGIILGVYEFDVFKKPAENSAGKDVLERITIIVGNDVSREAIRKVCERAAIVSLSANAARHLANTPANELTPCALASYAEEMARQSGCECVVLEETQMASLGMNALLGVARGSARPPRLITLRYVHSASAPTVALVGKGVTFDTGGVSLKPPEGMHEMKYDMCGAAAVICTMLAITQLRPAMNVVCVVPAVENKVGPEAQVPGDIVSAYDGTSIEVHNTDAEGRLILADALAYTIDKFQPAAIVDVATLTGACIVALGHYAAGIISNDERLSASLLESGERTGERLWRLPLWDDYRDLIKGTHADLCNIGPPKEAGTIVGGAFLEKFAGATPWAHLDIAGTAWGVKNIPYWDPKHATGFGVRLLTDWILGLATPRRAPKRTGGKPARAKRPSGARQIE